MELREELQKTLGSAYALERELVGGGMSRVFVAIETALGRRVAVKVLPAEMAGHVSVERFKREIAVAARLQHPHIVPLLTAGEMEGLPYFTMPFVKGESLRARLSKHGELPVSDAIRILREVASALAFAHDAGVVHRDIKPENVLLSAGAAMVTDFGVAKALSASSGGDNPITSLGIALGTPAYMSPEQASADPLVDHRADIYSWGVLAYELLTGTTPFAGRPPAAMLAAHTSEAAEPITKRRSAIPSTLATLVMRCLEKRPADRPQHAIEIVQALDAITTPSGGMQPTGAIPAVFQSRGRYRALIFALGIVAAVALASYAVVKRNRSALAMPGSVAVLPFDNAGRDTSLAYLADGITDEIHSQLTKVTGLTVRGRASAYRFKDSTISPQEAGAKLSVDALVVGKLTRSGTRLHVVVDLVRVADGTALWSDTYDQNTNDLSAVRDTITRAIVGALKLTLASTQRARRTENAEARDLYLRGRYASFKSSEADYKEALKFFALALEKDPQMAEAYAGVAWTYAFLADAYMSPAAAYPKTREAALHAIALDPNNAQAHLNLAMASAFLDWNFPAAEREFRRAIDLNPQLAEAYSTYAVALMFDSRMEASIAQADRAVAIDPLSTFAHWQRSWCLAGAGRFREAIRAHQKALEIDPRFFYGMSPDVWSYRALGLLDSALLASERDMKTAGGPAVDLVATYARMGRTKEAHAVLQSFEAQFRSGYVAPDLIVGGYSALGDVDKAFLWLDKVFETRSSLWHGLRWLPEWDAVRRDPRWAGFVKRAEAATR